MESPIPFYQVILYVRSFQEYSHIKPIVDENRSSQEVGAGRADGG